MELNLNKTTYDLSRWEQNRRTKRRAVRQTGGHRKACREGAEPGRPQGSLPRAERARSPAQGHVVSPLRPALAPHRCLPRRLNKMSFYLADVQRVQHRV